MGNKTGFTAIFYVRGWLAKLVAFLLVTASCLGSYSDIPQKS